MNFKNVKVHFYSRGFMPEYCCWSCHGKEDHMMYKDCNFGSFTHKDNFKATNQFQNMIFNVIGLSCLNSYNHSFEESLNEDVAKFL